MSVLKKLIAKILVLIGFTLTNVNLIKADEYKPYKTEASDLIYNLLFCDNLKLFSNAAETKSEPWLSLFAEEINIESLNKIASDLNEESRIRALAFNRLRAAKQSVPTKETLGVIIEVAMDSGLDTLAAFADGRVRYINHTGKMGIYEGGPVEVENLAKELVKMSQSIVDVIGPIEGKRLPPPVKGNVRLTFLVSDGLYMGEGDLNTIAQDSLSGPVFQKATELLSSITSKL